MSRRSVPRPYLAWSLPSRLSQRGMLSLLTLYVVTTTLAAVAIAAVLQVTARGDTDARRDVRDWGRLAFEAVWSGGGSFLHEDGQSLDFYLAAAVVKMLGVLLPIFLLGAFVFKLFQRDPFVWRNRLYYKTGLRSGDGFLLRYYNSDWSRLVAVDVTVYARLESRVTNKTLTRRLRCELSPGLGQGEGTLSDHSFWSVCTTGMPFTTRVSLESGRIVGEGDDRVLEIGGESFPLEKVTILALAQGVVECTGAHFTSSHEYRLSDMDDGVLGDIDAVNGYQSRRQIRGWNGWENFHGAPLHHGRGVLHRSAATKNVSNADSKQSGDEVRTQAPQE